MHYNIGRKVEVNPFEDVRFVVLSEVSGGIEKLSKFLNNRAKEVAVKKINGKFTICFNVELLDFTTLMQWYSASRGKFTFANSTVHFNLEGDVMTCW